MMLGMTSQIDLAAAAREHLPVDVADVWLSLLRPGIRLVAADDGDGPLVGHLGGEPELPDDLAWPVWEGRYQVVSASPADTRNESKRSAGVSHPSVILGRPLSISAISSNCVCV